jgi:hypothetical protein
MPSRLPRPRVDARRLEILRRAIGRRPFSFRDVWPSLSVVCSWSSSTCGMQLAALAPWLDGVPTHDATYSATEGWMNVPLGDGGPGGPLHPGAHVFELLEHGRAARADALVPLWEAEPGKDYEIFLTTAMGMIRYRLYDVVTCTGRFERSPIVHFKQKAGQQISLGLVQVAESEIVSALAEARVTPRGRWFFGPNAQGDGLVLYDDGENEDAGDVVPRVHDALRRLNTYYDAYAEKTLVRPIGHRSLPHDHEVWRRATHAQTKPRVLVQTAPLN